MNKAELIEAIAAESGLSKADAKRALAAFIDNVAESLEEGKSVTLKGFGTFSVKRRAARTGRNPQTGKAIQLSEKNVVRFKTSIDLAQKGTGDGGPRRS